MSYLCARSVLSDLFCKEWQTALTPRAIILVTFSVLLLMSVRLYKELLLIHKWLAIYRTNDFQLMYINVTKIFDLACFSGIYP